MRKLEGCESTVNRENPIRVRSTADYSADYAQEVQFQVRIGAEGSEIITVVSSIWE